MTDEEKKAAEEAQAQAEAEAKVAEEAAAAEEAHAAIDALEAKDAEIARLTEDRDNYRKVALKRLGKLPGDADFMEDADEKTGLTVEEQVKKTLLEAEIAKATKEKDEEARKLAKENAELRLALKNRPNGALGGGQGGDSEVKDNVFSKEQIEVLTAKAKRLNADPATFIENAKKNLQARA